MSSIGRGWKVGGRKMVWTPCSSQPVKENTKNFAVQRNGSSSSKEIRLID